MQSISEKIRKKIRDSFDSESKVLIRNSSWVFAGNAVSTGLAFLKTILTARIFGAELVGVYTISIAFVLTVQEFLRLNVAMGLIRFGAAFAAEGRKDKVIAVIKLSFLLSTAGGLLSIVLIAGMLLGMYDTFVKAPGLEIYIIGFAIANATSFTDTIAKATLKLHYKFKINTVIQVAMDILEFALIVTVLFLYPKDLRAFFIAVISSRLLNSIICNYAAYRELLPELRPWLHSRIDLMKDEYRSFLHYIFGNSLSSSLKVLMNQGDVLLLGHLSGTRAVGLYSTGKKLAYSVLTLTDPLASSIFPQFSHLVAQKKYADIRGMLGKVTVWLLLPALLLLLAAFAVREPLISSLYGKEFRDAANPFIISLIGALQGSVFFWSLPLIQSLGLIRKRFLVYITAIILGGITGILLIPDWGASGAALGLLGANLYITGRFIQASLQQLSKAKSAGENDTKTAPGELKEA